MASIKAQKPGGFVTPKGKLAEKNRRVLRRSKPTEPQPVKFQKRSISIARLMFLSKVHDKDIAQTVGVEGASGPAQLRRPPEHLRGAQHHDRNDPRMYNGSGNLPRETHK